MKSNSTIYELYWFIGIANDELKVILSIFVTRILTLCDTGLILHWVNQFEADIKPCTTEDYQQRKRKDKSTLTRLTLANLAGAFAVLVIGYLISILIFLKEMIFYHCMLLEKRNKDIAAVAWPVCSFHPKHLNRHLFNNQEVPVWWQVVSSGSFPLQNLYYKLALSPPEALQISTNFEVETLQFLLHWNAVNCHLVSQHLAV